MKDEKATRISESEWTVMECLWDSAQPVTLGEIVAGLGKSREKSWSYTTIRTLLVRLCDKGAAKADKTSGVYRYSAAIKREKCVREEMRSFVSRVFGDSPSSLVAALVRGGELDGDEREKILALITELKAKDK